MASVRNRYDHDNIVDVDDQREERTDNNKEPAQRKDDGATRVLPLTNIISLSYPCDRMSNLATNRPMTFEYCLIAS